MFFSNQTSSSNALNTNDLQQQQQQQTLTTNAPSTLTATPTSRFLKDYCTSESARSAVARQESEILRLAEESQHVIISQMLTKLTKRRNKSGILRPDDYVEQKDGQISSEEVDATNEDHDDEMMLRRSENDVGEEGGGGGGGGGIDDVDLLVDDIVFSSNIGGILGAGLVGVGVGMGGVGGGGGGGPCTSGIRANSIPEDCENVLSDDSSTVKTETRFFVNDELDRTPRKY